MMLRHLLCPVLLSAAASLALAHGSQQHRTDAFDAASAEQQPFGIAGDPAQASRTIHIKMTDNMRFSPSRIDVKQGETIRFVVTNRGKLQHEMVIGTDDELQKHAVMMREHPGMEHDEPHMSHVAPGKAESLVWTFNRAGDFKFACLVAGHFEAGMTGNIRVAPSRLNN